MSSRYACLLVVITAILVAVSWQLSCAQDEGKKIIKVRGSDSMAALVNWYANEFMQNHPKVHIIVSGGQDIPFATLLNKEADIIMASREIHRLERETAQRKGADVQGKVVGWGGIVIIVNPKNPTNELTVAQVRSLFSGTQPPETPPPGPLGSLVAGR